MSWSFARYSWSTTVRTVAPVATMSVFLRFSGVLLKLLLVLKCQLVLNLLLLPQLLRMLDLRPWREIYKQHCSVDVLNVSNGTVPR